MTFYLLRFIEWTDSNPHAVQSVASLCRQHQWMQSRLLKHTHGILRAGVQVVSIDSSNTTVVLPSQLSLREAENGDGHDYTPSSADPDTIVSLASFHCCFVKHLLWQESHLRKDELGSILEALLLLIGASSKPLASNAQDAILSMFSSNEINTVEAIRGSSSTIFFRVASLLNPGEIVQQDLMRIAAVIWLKWISRPDFHITQHEDSYGGSFLGQELYWKALQHGLKVGHQELKKYCLQILRYSLQMLPPDVPLDVFSFDFERRKDYVEAYEMFCSLYETIVIDRWINQVEESIPSLEQLTSPSSLVEPRWTTTILDAALRIGVQDSIRKAVGSWYLQRGIPPMHSVSGYREFLSQSFLPWVTQGALFGSTLSIKNRQVSSLHGDRLSAFVTRLLTSTNDAALLQEYSEDILIFLVNQGDRGFPYATTYILQGFINASAKSQVSLLNQQGAVLLTRLSERTAISEVARDYVTAGSVRLLEYYQKRMGNPLLEDAQCSGLSAKFRRLRDDRSFDDTWQKADNVPRASNGQSLEMSGMHTTLQHRLHHDGLLSTMDFLSEELNADNRSLDFDVCQTVQLLWDEVDLKEYPKRVMIRLPRVFFHSKVLQAAQQDRSLKDVLDEVLLALTRFCHGRVYVFAPLAKMFRNACLWGSCSQTLALGASVKSLILNPPQAKSEFLLEAATAEMLPIVGLPRSYEDYYGPKEGIGYAYFLDFLSRLGSINRELAQQVLDELLNPWMKQPVPAPIMSKWKTTLQLQAILILLEQCIEANDAVKVTDYLDKFNYLLSVEPLPRLRYLLEWIIARLYLRCPQERPKVLEMVVADEQANPKHLASMMKMAVMVTNMPDTAEEFAQNFMTRLIPLSTSPKIVVRYEAQWSVPAVWDRALARGWKSITENPAFVALNSYIRTLPKWNEPPAGRIVEWFDPIKDHNMVNLVEGDYLRLEPPERPLCTMADFTAIYTADPPPDDFPPSCLSLSTSHRNDATLDVVTQASSELGTDASSRPQHLQTKAQTLQADFLATAGRRTQASIVLICSLIDSPWNLGGLSRCAEIFGCERMTVRTTDVLKSKEFQSVAVTSHHHLPIDVVTPFDLPAFLLSKRKEGYTVVGIEQTDRSRVLGNEGTIFEEKLVLVIGSEAKGIPAAVLAECDWCVEIRQVGVTRSLNVQTAASVVLYEWWRQRGTGRAKIEVERSVEGLEIVD